MKENCNRWKLDPERLVISGESGGGYICFGAMVMLAQKKEANMVKAAFPIIPMMSDYFFSDPAGMTIEERFNQESMKVIWKYIAKVGGGLVAAGRMRLIIRESSGPEGRLDQPAAVPQQGPGLHDEGDASNGDLLRGVRHVHH